MTKYRLPKITSYERTEYIRGTQWSRVSESSLERFNAEVAQMVAEAVADLPEGSPIDNDTIADIFCDAYEEIYWSYANDYETDIDETYDCSDEIEIEEGDIYHFQFVPDEE